MRLCNFVEFQGLAKQSRVVSNTDIFFTIMYKYCRLNKKFGLPAIGSDIGNTDYTGNTFSSGQPIRRQSEGGIAGLVQTLILGMSTIVSGLSLGYIYRKYQCIS